jgi:predicted phage-related endonuclease
LRKGYISSTESAALFGQSPYFTAYEIAVMKRKADEATDDALIGSERMKWGLRLQDAIASGVAQDYGIEIEPLGLTYAVDDESRMGSSFDYKITSDLSDAGIAEDEIESEVLREAFREMGPGILEVKNVDSLEYKNKWNVVDGKFEAPDHIEIQLQHQLEVIGLKWGVIAAFVGGNRIALIFRRRDEKVGRIIRAKIKSFWDNFDKGILPDPVMPDDASVIIALNQYAEPDKYHDGKNDDVLDLLMSEYNRLTGEISSLVSAKETAKANILLVIKDAEKGESDHYKVSAGMRAPVRIEAYDRAGYRDFRVTRKKEKK